jgi:hypothetical protein
MTKLKRLCIDWFWPDRTTFIAKGRRYGIQYLVVGGLCWVIILPLALFALFLVKAEIDPKVVNAIASFETAIKASEGAPVVDFERALYWLRELAWFPEFVCYMFLLMLFTLSGWAFGCGILLLRANQAISADLEEPSAGPQVHSQVG